MIRENCQESSGRSWESSYHKATRRKGFFLHTEIRRRPFQSCWGSWEKKKETKYSRERKKKLGGKDIKKSVRAPRRKVFSIPETPPSLAPSSLELWGLCLWEKPHRLFPKPRHIIIGFDLLGEMIRQPNDRFLTISSREFNTFPPSLR